MIIAIVTLVISFLYEGFISNYITSYFNNYNIFTTLYTLIALVVLLPYFANKKTINNGYGMYKKSIAEK